MAMTWYIRSDATLASSKFKDIVTSMILGLRILLYEGSKILGNVQILQKEGGVYTLVRNVDSCMRTIWPLAKLVRMDAMPIMCVSVCPYRLQKNSPQMISKRWTSIQHIWVSPWWGCIVNIHLQFRNRAVVYVFYRLPNKSQLTYTNVNFHIVLGKGPYSFRFVRCKYSY